MRSKKIVVQALVAVAGIFLMVSSNIFAVECMSDIDCSGKVGIGDLTQLKIDYNKAGCDPCMCSPIYNCPTGMMECSGMCVDPMTDEANCGVCGNVCASYEMCVSGNCDQVTPLNSAPVAKTGQTTYYDTAGTLRDCYGTGEDSPETLARMAYIKQDLNGRIRGSLIIMTER